ncbi:juvenile hormone acid O-methyltransferase-like [Phlebotomus papatasi]|uniref:juvenile hormone acid O-methyltransferase-like n=1 Tax=Phlebotomus papatasi TaxID=29031 RepID=UPI002483999B|nr:juvenile hormone acid O-methyltransferase-like [Phlebotomus papatasi]
MSNLYNVRLLNKFSRIRDVHASLYFKKRGHLLKWKPNESILDVGCGTGDLSYKYIYPMLPKDFSRFVCTDISKTMLQQAEQQFSGIPKVQFDILDIASEVEGQMKCTFDHIFSLYCIVWVSEQRKAFQNIYDMLKPGGECFLIFLDRHFVMDTVFQLSERPKWKKFFPDINKTHPFPYRFDSNPVKTITDMMKLIGYVNIKVHLERTNFVFHSAEEYIGFIKAIPNPLSLMTSEEQKNYLKESVELAYDLKIIQESVGDYETGRFLVVYGEK